MPSYFNSFGDIRFLPHFVIENFVKIMMQFLRLSSGISLLEQAIDEQRLKDLEKKKSELEESLEMRQREVQDAEDKYSKAFVEFQAKISKFEEEKKRLLEEVYFTISIPEII